MSCVLSIRDLSKTFESARRRSGTVTALDEVSLDVADGEFVTVLGPSGCGKTTLLRAVAGFDDPDSGSITLDGRDLVGPGVRSVAAHDRGIGLVPQEGALFPHLSVAQNVGFGLTGLRRRERRERVEATLELVGLGGFGSRRPHELSGGQQQRVAVARAVAPGPRVILFDEPFSALDEYLRESLRDEVRQLLTDLRATVLLVTHDQEEALALGDRVVVMREGAVVQAASPREAYYQPADLSLARFLGDAVVLKGDVVVGEGAPSVSCAFGTLPVASWHGQPGECNVLIRPENIRVSPPSAQACAACGRAQPCAQCRVCGGCPLGTICGSTFYGHDGMIRVRVPDVSKDISVRVLGDRPFAVGDRVQLAVDSPVCTYPR